VATCLSQALIHAIKQLNAVEAMEGLPDKHRPNCNRGFHLAYTVEINSKVLLVVHTVFYWFKLHAEIDILCENWRNVSK